MPNSKTFAIIFHDKPAQWGLRGDPHLWDEMEIWFRDVPCPKTSEEFSFLIEKAFAELTGFPINHSDNFFLEKYNHGGMSTGYICPAFWRDRTLPQLLVNFREFIATVENVDDPDPEDVPE